MIDRQAGERFAVKLLIDWMALNGWRVGKVWDGEEWDRPGDTDGVLNTVFNLDECAVYFKRVDDPRKSTDWVAIVLGNSWYEVVADNLIVDEEFARLIDRFSAAVDVLEYGRDR